MKHSFVKDQLDWEHVPSDRTNDQGCDLPFVITICNTNIHGIISSIHALVPMLVSNQKQIDSNLVIIHNGNHWNAPTINNLVNKLECE